ncbi:MAG: copper chaperone PCu(A)C [Steroidobacteraceae bacterium]
MPITDYRVGLPLLIALGLLGCSKPATEAPAAATATTESPAAMEHGEAAGLMVHEAWARPTSPIATVGAAYMTITNHGMATDHLLGASSPVAAEVQLHGSTDDNGVMRMRPVENLEITPHGSATMDPGGMHFMLMELKAPLVAGSHFPLTLKFEQAGEVTVDVVVQDGAGGHAHAG